MAEPARRPPTLEGERVRAIPDDASVLQRWVRRSDGSMELLELPLTRELFLDPQIGDKMVQGFPHVLTVSYLFTLVHRRFKDERGTLVLSDVKHLLGPGLGPVPDLAVIRGLPDPDYTLRSYDLRETGVAPRLIVEVVSPDDAETRRTDEVDKVQVYERIGVAEYLLVYLPLKGKERPYRIAGYRRGESGRYQPLEPDAQGRFVSQTTGLAFAVNSQRDWIEIFDLATGERLLDLSEEEDARRAAEASARAAEERAKAAEVAARAAEERAKAAEEELARLRAEIEASGAGR